MSTSPPDDQASAASLGYGSYFLIESSTSPGEYFYVSEVFTISPPAEKIDQIDITHYKSQSKTREFVDGYLDPGECSVEMNYAPGSETDLFIKDLIASAKGTRTRNCRVIFPNTVFWTFQANITGYEIADPVDNRMTATLTFRVGGAVADSGAAPLPPEPPGPPVNTVLPSVSGVVDLGTSITGTDGEYDGTEPITLEYRWLRALTSGGVPIGEPGAWLGVLILGANDANYVTEAADSGEFIFREERASNIYGSTDWISSSNYIGPIESYVGAGDIVSGALMWWGLRAYSAATVGDPCVRISRADAPATQQDFVTLGNGDLDIAGIAAFLTGTTGKIVTLYDQTGNGRHVSQSTDGDRLAYVEAAIGSALSVFRGAGSQGLITAATFGGTSSQPGTLVAVAKRTGSFSSFGFLVSAEGQAPWLAFSTSPNTVEIFAGSAEPQVAATDNVWHSLIAVFNGASSKVYVDGSVSTVSAGTNFIQDYKHLVGSFDSAGGNGLTGDMVEGGFWPGGFDATQAANMTANHQDYWGI